MLCFHIVPFCFQMRMENFICAQFAKKGFMPVAMLLTMHTAMDKASHMHVGYVHR